MSEQVEGFMLAKSPPKTGEVESLSVKQETGKSGKPYLRVRRDGPDYGGSEFRVITATQAGDPDQRGNTPYNVTVEPVGEMPQIPLGGSGSARNGSNTRSGGGDRDEEIARAVAFKGAVELVASGSAEPSVEAVQTLTSALLPIVKGEKPLPPTPDTAESVQADATGDPDTDIPF